MCVFAAVHCAGTFCGCLLYHVCVCVFFADMDITKTPLASCSYSEYTLHVALEEIRTGTDVTLGCSQFNHTCMGGVRLRL